MRQRVRTLVMCVLVVLFGGRASAQVTQVVPTDRETTAGTATFLGPLANAQRTYQFLINQSELTSLVGLDLTGLTYRMSSATAASWPAADVTFGNYDVYLSQSVAPADRSLTFANNIVGTQTQVRAGSLTIPAGSFNVTPGSPPHAFGPVINFDTPYTYNGDHLLIELRHTGFTGTSGTNDAMAATGGAANGYGTRFSAAWTGSYTGTSGSQGNFVIVQLTAVPEPASIALCGFAAAVFGRRILRRRAVASETN